MLKIIKFFFHIICTIGRCFRRALQTIIGRRHEELGAPVSRTEPVTLEDIRVISALESDSNRPYQSFISTVNPSTAEWNSWGAQDIFRNSPSSNNSPTADKNDEHVDYFSDIAATVKKTPTIVMKKRANDNNNSENLHAQRLNRLQMTNDDLLSFQPGLDEWQEGDSNTSATAQSIWNDHEDFNELSNEANEALRESRRIEREKKLREHQQRKIQKEASRTSHTRDSLS